MEFSLAHLTLLDCAPPELTEIAARAGFDYVSYRPIGLGLPTEPNYPLATDRALLARTKAALRATGVKLLDIELARIYPGVDVRDYLPALEVAAELRARAVCATLRAGAAPWAHRGPRVRHLRASEHAQRSGGDRRRVRLRQRR